MPLVGRVESGVDYLTTTWPAPAKETVLGNTRNIIEWAERRNQDTQGKDLTRAWAWQGYRGMKCGQVCVGERLDGTIVKLEGQAANDWFAAGLPIGHNVSRIDVAITMWSELNRDAVIALHNLEALDCRNTLHSRPFKVRHILGQGDGDTLYVGKRISELFVRVYDKELAPNSKPEHKGATRYEIECKERLAQQVSARLVARPYSASHCMEICAGLLARRGIVPMVGGRIRSEIFSPDSRPRTDIERTLLWLATQVKPKVGELIREGYELEVLTALGLGHFWEAYQKCD